MPRRDGTGPMGQGAMTGRGLGLCRNSNNAYGRGTGFGYGFGRGFDANVNDGNSHNKSILAEQKAALEARLEEINRQLNQQ